MVKLLVALLVAMMALVGPVAAQDPDSQSNPPPEGEPSSGQPAGNETASRSQAGPACQLADLFILDPKVPVTRWVIVDPDGCIRHIVYRTLGWPPVKTVRNLL